MTTNGHAHAHANGNGRSRVGASVEAYVERYPLLADLTYPQALTQAGAYVGEVARRFLTAGTLTTAQIRTVEQVLRPPSPPPVRQPGEHEWVLAAEVPLPPERAASVVRRNTTKIAEATLVRVTDVYCAGCRLTFDRGVGRACEADGEHLRGGTPGARRRAVGDANGFDGLP